LRGEVNSFALFRHPWSIVHYLLFISIIKDVWTGF
jgi:hypothetical protein